MYLLFTDGGSRGNPGKSACGFVIYSSDAKLDSQKIKNLTSDEIVTLTQSAEFVEQKGEFLGIQTNNFAEWQGVLVGLKSILDIHKSKVDTEPLEVAVFLDSLLVAQQASGVYKVKNENLKPLFKEFLALKNSFSGLAFRHIYREFNKDADSQVNECLDAN